MTIKDAILKTLEELKKPTTYSEVTEFIKQHKLVEFTGLTPEATVSAQLGDFLRKNDTRVGRYKDGKTYFYYLMKNDRLVFPSVEAHNLVSTTIEGKKKQNFYERDLHRLFVSYLKSKGILAKTIFHEESKNNKDDYQKWVHPDIVAAEFVVLKNNITTKFLKTVEKKDSFALFSYELKKEIRTDYDLKKSYFQAVSNSSWANYGFLVIFDFDTKILQEMERLNKAFGIGVIHLHANPFESQILFPSAYRELDYQTIDKLCEINEAYKNYIVHIEKILDAEDKYLSGAKQELESFCDMCLTSDQEIDEYCRQYNIPVNEI